MNIEKLGQSSTATGSSNSIHHVGNAVANYLETDSGLELNNNVAARKKRQKQPYRKIP